MPFLARSSGPLLVASLAILSCGGGNTATPAATAPEPAAAGGSPRPSSTPGSPVIPSAAVDDGSAGADEGVAPAASAAPATRCTSPAQIRAVVIGHKGALQACYELEARTDPSLHGGVTVSWRVDASGAVTEADLVGSTLGNARVEGCVLRQVRSWRFPATGTGGQVTFPFAFGMTPQAHP